jgi:hypothetical protein
MGSEWSPGARAVHRLKRPAGEPSPGRPAAAAGGRLSFRFHEGNRLDSLFDTAGLSVVSVAGAVESGDELAVGGPGSLQFLVTFGKLAAQFDASGRGAARSQELARKGP